MTHTRQIATVKPTASFSRLATRLLIVVFVLLLQLGSHHYVNAVCEECTGTPRENKECNPSRIDDCLILKCRVSSSAWFLTSTTNNVTIGTSEGDNRLTNYVIIGELGPNGETYLWLNITKNTLQNYGSKRILAQQSSSFGGNFCYFTMFVYEDTANVVGNFTFNGVSKRIDSTDIFEVNIDSFANAIYYSFQLDAFPMDYLIVNGTQIPSQDCTQDLASVRCLRSNQIEFPFERCVTNYTINLGYGFFEFPPYTFPVPTYPQNIRLQYPPKVRYSVVDIPYSSLDTEVLLRCEVECGNPTTYTYTWRRQDNTLIEQTSGDLISYRVQASSVNDVFEVTCTVTNFVSSATNTGESRTRFVLKYLDINATKSSGDLPVWAIVLIALGGFLLLVLLVLLVLLLYRRQQKEKEKPKKEPSKEMTPNPVYGNTTLANINRSQTPSRSDRVYTVEDGLNPNNTRYDNSFTSDTRSKTRI